MNKKQEDVDKWLKKLNEDEEKRKEKIKFMEGLNF